MQMTFIPKNKNDVPQWPTANSNQNVNANVKKAEYYIILMLEWDLSMKNKHSPQNALLFSVNAIIKERNLRRVITWEP